MSSVRPSFDHALDNLEKSKAGRDYLAYMTTLLNSIEQQRNIRIIYAAEVHTNPLFHWSYTAPMDPEFELTFVYVGLNDTRQKDLPLSGTSGKRAWSGYDVRAALDLASTGSGVLTELFSSPIVYRNLQATPAQMHNFSFLDQMRRVLWRQNNVSPMLFHYHFMGGFIYDQEIDKQQAVLIGHYLNAIRFTLITEWLMLNRRGRVLEALSEDDTPQKLVEMDLDRVLDEMRAHLPTAVHAALGGFLKMRRDKGRLVKCERIPIIDEWIVRMSRERKTLVKEIAEEKESTANSKRDQLPLIGQYQPILRTVLSFDFSNEKDTATLATTKNSSDK